MFKILRLNAIASMGLAQLPADNYQVLTDYTNPDAILVRSMDLQAFTLNPALKVIGRAGVGVNNIPVSRCTTLGIPVLNTPGANANAVRELVIAGLLLASRHICQAWSYVQGLTLQGEALQRQIEQDKKRFSGVELLGKTLGVIGLGSVGVEVANAAVSLGMNVIGFDPSIAVHHAWKLSAQVTQALQLKDVLRTADFISVHVPLIAATQNMLSTEQFSSMKSGAVLLNFAREGVIDTTALLTALEAKHVAAYINDFPNELKNHPRVISLPHLGASTSEAEENCAVMICQQLRNFLENGSITHSVNFPELMLSRLETKSRLLIVNQNIPSMVAQISATLAKAKLNIYSLANKSRDQIAYTVIDVDADIDATVATAIRQIKGVISLRVICV